MAKIVPIRGAAARRRMGGAAMLIREPKEKKKSAPKKPKVAPATLVIASNDIDDVEEEIEEWDTSASLDVVKTFRPDQFNEATKSADASASGSNVDFVVYEVREIYRAKRGF